MKIRKALLIIISISIGLSATAQKASKVQITGKRPGICDRKSVYALQEGHTGQEVAKTSVSKGKIVNKLNSEVAYLQEKSKQKLKE